MTANAATRRCPICSALIFDPLPDTTTCGAWKCRDALAPRPVSPEAARETIRCAACGRECEPVNDSDAPVTHCVDCPKDPFRPAEAAPPRATTPEYPPLELAARNTLLAFWDWEHYDDDTVRAARRAALRELSKCLAACREARFRAPLAGSPSLESGALLDAYEEAARDHGAGKTRGLTMTLARGELDRRLSTLERDAADIAAELQRVYAVNSENARLYWEADDARASLERDAARVRDLARTLVHAMATSNPMINGPTREAFVSLRAALSPSGEPTTTPETNDDGE